MISISWTFQTSEILCCKSQIQLEWWLSSTVLSFYNCFKKASDSHFPKWTSIVDINQKLCINLRNTMLIWLIFFSEIFSEIFFSGCWATAWPGISFLITIKCLIFSSVFYTEWICVYICCHNPCAHHIKNQSFHKSK